jgi:hypothetical protein
VIHLIPDPDKSVRRPLSAFIEGHPLSVIVSVAVGAFLLGGGAVSWVLFNGYVPNQLYTLQTKLDECRGQKSITSPAPTIAGKAEDAVSDEWTPLSPEQIDSWANKLSPYHTKLITVFWSQEVDARRFFRSLQAVGNRLSCDVKAGLGQADGHEIAIYANKNDPAGPIILQLFKSLNWPASLDTDDRQEIDIFIPQKSS